MGRIRDFTGQVFGRLTVLGPAGKKGRNSVSLCRCQCGKEKVILNLCLLSGATKSCGCLIREVTSARVKANPPRLKHGLRRTITYSSWLGMVNRCLNPKNEAYATYGACGIMVCERWADMDVGILNFIEDMGHRPSPAHSIDRIDGKKGYEPSNCRWATASQQMQNVGLKKSNTTGFKGIAEDKRGKAKPWRAEIRNDGDRFNLGSYTTKEEAALAYNIASERLHGPYGVRNALQSMPPEVVKRVYKEVTAILNL